MDIIAFIDTILDSEDEAYIDSFLDNFDARGIDLDEFCYYIADIFAVAVQYGHHT